MTEQAGTHEADANGQFTQVGLGDGLESSAPEETPGERRSRQHRWKRRVTLVAGLITLVVAGIVLPPLINIGHYKRQIAALMTRSMGRPVHMSGVELRLLPRPGFVLHDLSVGEDPAFGAEPILSARTVVASIRILSLWRGKIEISRVSVDEASLNLVRSAQGRWNLETLMTGGAPDGVTGGILGPNGVGATRQPGAGSGMSAHFPYLEATNSRVNLKNGLEKRPYSLVDTDLSLWQDDPGEWSVRLKGQPVRTDIEMSLADTGEVRMDASLHSAAQLREMPIHLQLEWRDAQLGQLSRLLFSSDAGWRGDVSADIDVEGTLDNALTKARLRATGVRRAEFAPETPLDFDANCTFRFQHSQSAVHDIGCDTAIGDGRLHLKAELPGVAGQPEAVLDVKDLPLQAGLDLLRTVRSGFAPGISIKGTANGSLAYKEVTTTDPENALKSAARPQLRTAKLQQAAKKDKGEEAVPANLHGSLILDGVELKGGELKEALVFPRMTWAPAMLPGTGLPVDGRVKERPGLATRFTIALPAGAQSIAVRLGLGSQGYDAGMGGTVGVAKLRELAYAFGWPHQAAADGFSGGTADLNLTASGPWISDIAPVVDTGAGAVVGSLTLHRTQWSAAYLARPVEMTQAIVTIAANSVVLASDFSYGNAKDAEKSLIQGSMTVSTPSSCSGTDTVTATGTSAECEAQIELRLGALDAAQVQAALLGSPEEKSLFSPLMDRMRSSDRPKLPEVTIHAQAESLLLGTTTLEKPAVQLKLKPSEVVLESWSSGLLGGSAHGTGSFAWVNDKPGYVFEGEFQQINAGSLGSFLHAHWTGGPVSGRGKVELSGSTQKELGASASGSLHFDWKNGVVSTVGGGVSDKGSQALRFDAWSGDLKLGQGKVELGDNALKAGRKSSSFTGSLIFGGPVKLAASPEKAAGSDRGREAATVK